MPVPLLAPALRRGCVPRAAAGRSDSARPPGGTCGRILRGSDASPGAATVAVDIDSRDRGLAGHRRAAAPGCWPGPTFLGCGSLRALVTLPLVLPPVVGGVALLLAFGRKGFVGRYLDQWFGITIPFSPAAVIMAETFVAMPFLIITVEGALRSADLGVRGGSRHAGGRQDDGVPAHHRPAGRAFAGCGRGAVLGAGPG